MLKVFLSSTFRDLKDTRSEILNKLDSVLKGVGMEEFLPDGDTSQKICITDLKKSDIVIFLISPYYGSSIKFCELKENCKADCPMKTGEGHISYTHCEYKTTIAEGILHQTYLIKKGWDAPDVKREALQFKEEIGEEYLGFVEIEDPNLARMMGEYLTENILKWHTQEKLNFTDFCDRSGELSEILENIDSNLEVYGEPGIGKSALIQVALLLQRLKGREIIAISIGKSNASGSGYEDFRKKREDIQYIIKGNEISLNDILEALKSYLPDIEELRKKETDKIIDTISEFLGRKESPIVFIDDFHLANKDARKLVIASEGIIFSSRKKTGLAKKEICLKGIREEFREDFINIIANYHDMTLPESVIKRIVQIAEGHPVSMIYLIKNYPIINFDKLAALKKKIYPEDFIYDPNIFLNYY